MTNVRPPADDAADEDSKSAAGVNANRARHMSGRVVKNSLRVVTPRGPSVTPAADPDGEYSKENVPPNPRAVGRPLAVGTPLADRVHAAGDSPAKMRHNLSVLSLGSMFRPSASCASLGDAALQVRTSLRVFLFQTQC